MKKVIVTCLLFMACSCQRLNACSGQLFDPVFTVFFGFDAYSLNAAAKAQLDSIVADLKTGNPQKCNVEISAFCDTVGSNAYNDALSIRRAQSVKAYLVSKGINDTLITGIKGFGKRKSFGSNPPLNRKVEIHINLNIEAPALVVDTLNINASKLLPDTSGIKTIDISQAQINDIIQLPDINFFPDRHLITDASHDALKILLNTMYVNKTLKIEIRGHVCCLPNYQGDALDGDTYTEDLSLRRAREIYLYLSENGIERNRMTYIGLGAKYPLVKEITEHDKALNRRVEIRILGK